MKNKFFLCLRPVATETADGKLYPVVIGKLNSGRRTPRDLIDSQKTLDASLRKRAGDRNVHPLKSNVLDKSENKSENPKSGELDSNKTSLSPCSSSVSDQKSFPRSGSFSNSLNYKKKQSKVNKGGPVPDFNSGMYLIVISLFVTMFWGKVFGILCTSIGFYFVHRRSDCDRRSSENMVISPDRTPTTEYKKRVIMEGLLERNHHRHGIKLLT